MSDEYQRRFYEDPDADRVTSVRVSPAIGLPQDIRAIVRRAIRRKLGPGAIRFVVGRVNVGTADPNIEVYGWAGRKAAKRAAVMRRYRKAHAGEFTWGDL